jgi:hypothetical protein
VVWIEAPAGDIYFSSPEDVEQHSKLFGHLHNVALSITDSVSYLPQLATEVERYTEQMAPRR